MKLKVTLHRPGTTAPADIAIIADPGAHVGDVARAIAAADPLGATAGVATLTLRVADDHGDRVVSPQLSLARAGVRSGAAIALVDGAGRFDDSSVDAEVAATLVVERGPDAGKQFALRPGSNFVGRGPGNDINLSDKLVSKNHARIDVTDIVQIIDRGSVNGVFVGDEAVSSAVLQVEDRALVGDTLLRVLPQAQGVSVSASRGATIEFNRSPRLDPLYVGPNFDAPEPPAPPTVNPLPFVALVAPILMGGAMYAITQNPLTVLFVALSPLMMIGNVIEQRLFGKRNHKRAVALFRERLAALETSLAANQPEEIAARCREHPSAGEVAAAAAGFDPLLWTRRPDRHGFLTARLGLGRLATRAVIDVPDTRRGVPELSAELREGLGRWAQVDGVPVVLDLVTCGAVGVAGPRQQSLAAAAGLVVQLAGTHSPAEMVLGALTSSRTAPDWAWLRWLPHTESAHSPIQGALADASAAAVALVAELEELINMRQGTRRSPGDAPVVPAVVLVIENDAPVERSRLVGLAESGPAQGVHVIWVGTATQQLPAACTTFLTVDPSSGDGAVGLVEEGVSLTPVALELVERAQAEQFARSLAPLVDSGAKVDDTSSVPRSVSLLALLDTALARDPQAVLDRWHQSFSVPGTDRQPDSAFDRGIRAIVGVGAAQEMTLDLRAQGPHALVGGPTGSGKSEFLQSWVAALAVSYSPARVTFLFVDYKGGSAFRDCVELPHTVGLVTDLNPHLVRRVLVSLHAELHHRERLLEQKRAKDLLELEHRGDPDAPPSLIIVVDEFAALVNEVPEFVDGVVNVAQRGRSLGLHLILATQRPAGVIKDNLRANTNMRIALRMADEEDSANVVGTPLAATFDPDIPGRAVVKFGPGRVHTFQSGYVGGWTPNEAPPPDITIEEVRFGPAAPWVAPKQLDALPVAAKGPTDLRRLVDAAGAAFTSTGMAAPRRPWLKELAPCYDLARTRQSRTDTELFFAVLDHPQRQAQHEIAFAPDRDGNMAVVGTGGSGKTTVLRTLAVAAGLSTRSGPCHVYAIDFGGRGLQMLEPLPHVGAIVPGEDHERLTRLLRFLRETSTSGPCAMPRSTPAPSPTTAPWPASRWSRACSSLSTTWLPFVAPMRWGTGSAGWTCSTVLPPTAARLACTSSSPPTGPPRCPPRWRPPCNAAWCCAPPANRTTSWPTYRRTFWSTPRPGGGSMTATRCKWRCWVGPATPRSKPGPSKGWPGRCNGAWIAPRRRPSSVWPNGWSFPPCPSGSVRTRHWAWPTRPWRPSACTSPLRCWCSVPPAVAAPPPWPR